MTFLSRPLVRRFRSTITNSNIVTTSDTRPPIVPYPQTPRRFVPPNIPRPPYAASGIVPMPKNHDKIILYNDTKSLDAMRAAARLARQTLDLACSVATYNDSDIITTDDIDAIVHEAIISAGAYPSPLNYAGFPKSVCTSINEVICHGIPDTRPLQLGDVVSFDVSCFLNGVHGDNCATIIIGDAQEHDEIGTDWRGVPYKTNFDSAELNTHFVNARRLVQATREGLYAAIETCRPGSCLSHIGAAIHSVADSYGYTSVQKYRGHGIGSDFHCAPFVKHYRNNDKLVLRPGMIFTIEPMFCVGRADCSEWDDDWTVVTNDGSLAAQFEHTVLITETGVEIITVNPDGNDE